AYWYDLQSGHHRRFRRVLQRDQYADSALLARAERNGQNTLDRPHCPVERQFANHNEILKLVGFELFAGGNHADGDGQVEAWPLFLYVRWGKVDRGPTESEAEAGVDQGGCHTVAGFLNRSIRKPNDDNKRVAVAGVDFDFDWICFNPANCRRTDLG